MELHPVFQRQLETLASGDLDALLDNYAPDAALIRFDRVAQGIEEVTETLRGYLTFKPELVELTDYAESQDTIVYRAVMKLNGQPRNAVGTMVIRDGKIWHQTAALI